MSRARIRTYYPVAGAVVMIGLVVALGSSAAARTQKTPSLTQASEGYLYCRVVATSTMPIGLTASIMSDAGTNVTEFGYGSRVKTEDGFDAEETAGSFNHDGAQYCRVTVTRARRKNVQVSLTAFDKDGVPIATVEAR
jgi:hypothetical protein